MSAYALELFGHVRRIRTEDAQYFVKEVALGEAIRRHIKRAGVVLAENLRRVLILQRAIMHPQTQPLPYPPFHKLIGCLLATENRAARRHTDNRRGFDTGQTAAQNRA